MMIEVDNGNSVTESSQCTSQWRNAFEEVKEMRMVDRGRLVEDLGRALAEEVKTIRKRVGPVKGVVERVVQGEVKSEDLMVCALADVIDEKTKSLLRCECVPEEEMKELCPTCEGMWRLIEELARKVDKAQEAYKREGE